MGAVLVDADDRIVAEGRNRIGEADAPAGRLRNTSIAHAEMDVLAQLPLGDYTEFRLYTTLEPCLLCRSAATMAGVGTVHFLAADPICRGLEQLAAINAHAARRAPTMIGPGGGPEAFFAIVLPVAVLVAFDASSLDVYSEAVPEVVAAARRAVEERLWPSRRCELDEAVAALEVLRDGP